MLLGKRLGLQEAVLICTLACPRVGQGRERWQGYKGQEKSAYRSKPQLHEEEVTWRRQCES